MGICGAGGGSSFSCSGGDDGGGSVGDEELARDISESTPPLSFSFLTCLVFHALSECS